MRATITCVSGKYRVGRTRLDRQHIALKRFSREGTLHLCYCSRACLADPFLANEAAKSDLRKMVSATGVS